MGAIKIKEAPPLGYRRSYKFRRSDKLFIAGAILFLSGALIAYNAFLVTEASPDLLGLRAAQTSPFQLLTYALNQSFHFRLGAGLTILGLIALLIGYLALRDERNGTIDIPPKYEKK